MMLDSKLDVRCDGAESLTDLASFFHTHGTPLPWHTDRVALTTMAADRAKWAAYRRTEIPFNTGCTVEVVNSSATAAAIARRTRVRPRIRRASIPCTSLNLTYAPLWLRKVRALLTGADLPLVMLGAPVKESQRVPYNEGTPACEFAARW